MKQYLNMEEWAKEQWATNQLGDLRRNNRAVKLAVALINRPHESLSCQTGDWANLKAAYRFLSTEEISHLKLQKNHWQNTLKKANHTSNTVLLVDARPIR